MARHDEEEGSTSGKIVITGNVVLGMPSGLTPYCRQARPATAPFRHCQTRLRCIAAAVPHVLPDDRSKLAPATCHVAATWQMIGAYEDVLARVIADGTDDLVTPSRQQSSRVGCQCIGRFCTCPWPGNRGSPLHHVSMYVSTMVCPPLSRWPSPRHRRWVTCASARRPSVPPSRSAPSPTRGFRPTA